MATDFIKELYADVYKTFCDFDTGYYGIDNLLTGSGVNPVTFKSIYPIHVFDVSKQSERLTEGVVDLTVRMNLVQMYPRIRKPRIRKPMLSCSVFECSNLKAMD